MPRPAMSVRRPTLALFGLLLFSVAVRFSLGPYHTRAMMALAASVLIALLVALFAGALAAVGARLVSPDHENAAFNIGASAVLLSLVGLLWYFLIRSFLA